MLWQSINLESSSKTAMQPASHSTTGCTARPGTRGYRPLTHYRQFREITANEEVQDLPKGPRRVTDPVAGKVYLMWDGSTYHP